MTEPTQPSEHADDEEPEHADMNELIRATAAAGQRTLTLIPPPPEPATGPNPPSVDQLIRDVHTAGQRSVRPLADDTPPPDAA